MSEPKYIGHGLYRRSVADVDADIEKAIARRQRIEAARAAAEAQDAGIADVSPVPTAE